MGEVYNEAIPGQCTLGEPDLRKPTDGVWLRFVSVDLHDQGQNIWEVCECDRLVAPRLSPLDSRAGVARPLKRLIRFDADFTCRILKAGHSATTARRYVASLSDQPLSERKQVGRSRT
jgi:hypothetical protein